MAELAVAASIAGLVNLADSVFCHTYKYVRTIKSATKDIASLLSEMNALYGVLTQLRLLYGPLEDHFLGSRSQGHHIHSCFETLERIEMRLKKEDTTLVQAQRSEVVKRKLRWPFTSSEVKELVIEIERHKSTLGLALQVDGMAGLLQALSRQDDLDRNLTDIRHELQVRREAENRVMIDEQRQKILDSFGSFDHQRSLEMSRKLRHPNTGLWLTESPEFKNWLQTPDARLWLMGYQALERLSWHRSSSTLFSQGAHLIQQ